MEDKIFCELFPEIENEIKKKLKSSETTSACGDINSIATNGLNSNLNQTINNRGFSILGNVFCIVGFAAFALVVKYVFNTI